MSYGTTPTLDDLILGDEGWGNKNYDNQKKIVDFLGTAHNADGTLKAGVGASQWQVVGGAITWVSTTSFKVPTSAAFEVGRKVWVDQIVDVIGEVVSATDAGGFTTVVLAKVVLYSDNTTVSTLTNDITAVSVGFATPRTVPSVRGNNGGGISALIVEVTSSTTIDVTADEIPLRNAATLSAVTASFVTRNISITLNMGTAGIGGIQTGSSEVNSKMYAAYVVEKSSDGTQGGQLVPEGTAFSFEAGGWDRQRRVGWVYNDASGNLESSTQYDNRFMWNDGTTDLVLAAGTSDTFTLVSPLLPSTSTHAILSMFNVATLSGSGNAAVISLDGTASHVITSISGDMWYQQLNSSSQFYYKRLSAAATCIFTNHGWIDNL